jgi:hypothetical protein
MNNDFYISLIENSLAIIEHNGKSADLAELLINLQAPEGIISDFLIELSLTANPQEEVGVGCYSVKHLQAALVEFKMTGSTQLLNELK